MRKWLFSVAVCGMLAVPGVGRAADCSFSRDLELKSRGADVSCLQQFLAEENFLNSEPTGYFGVATEKAVKDWQKERGVKPSGYFGALSRRMYSSGSSVTPLDTMQVGAVSSAASMYANSSVTPIVGVGRSDQRIASFLITSPNEQGLVIFSLTFDRDRNPDILLSRLKVFVNGKQFGATKVTVGAYEPALVFTAATPVTLSAASTAVVEVRADIDPESKIGTYYSVIDAVGWFATGAVSRAAITFSGMVEGQPVSVTAAGDIYNTIPNVAITSGVVPILSAGTRNQRIASFTITGPSDKSLSISVLNFDKDADPGITLHAFKVLVNGAQFGSTRTTVGSADDNIALVAPQPFVLQPGATAIVDVYADIDENATVGSHISVIDLVNWSVTGGSPSGTVAFPAPVEGQAVTIALGGTLQVAMASVSSTTVLMGSTMNELGALQLTADGIDALKINSLTVHDNIVGGASGSPSFYNFTLWDGATQVAGPVSLKLIGSGGVANFRLSTPLILARNTTKALTLKADVYKSQPSASPSSQHRFGVASGGDVGVVGVGTPLARVNVVGLPQSLDPIFVSPQSVTLRFSTQSTIAARSLSMGTVGHELAIFRITADNGDDVAMTELTFHDAITKGSTGVPSFINLTLWDGDTKLAGPVAMMMSGLGERATVHFTFDSPVVFAQSSTRTLTLKADVASFASGGAVADSSHVFSIESQSDIVTRAAHSLATKVVLVGLPARGRAATIIFQN